MSKISAWSKHRLEIDLVTGGLILKEAPNKAGKGPLKSARPESSNQGVAFGDLEDEAERGGEKGRVGSGRGRTFGPLCRRSSILSVAASSRDLNACKI